MFWFHQQQTQVAREGNGEAYLPSYNCLISHQSKHLQQQQSLLCCWASLHFDSWIYSIIYESYNVLTSPANNMRIKETSLKEEEILVTMSCHGMVVFSVHRPPGFNSIPCFPWFASLAFGSCPILARGGGSQWAGAPCTICTTHTNCGLRTNGHMGTIKAYKCSSSVKLNSIAKMAR